MASVKNSTMLLNMIGMLETKEKQHWKDYLPTPAHAYNCTKNNAMDFSLYHLMHRVDLDSPLTSDLA